MTKNSNLVLGLRLARHRSSRAQARGRRRRSRLGRSEPGINQSKARTPSAQNLPCQAPRTCSQRSTSRAESASVGASDAPRSAIWRRRAKSTASKLAQPQTHLHLPAPASVGRYRIRILLFDEASASDSYYQPAALSQ